MDMSKVLDVEHVITIMTADPNEGVPIESEVLVTSIRFTSTRITAEVNGMEVEVKSTLGEILNKIANIPPSPFSVSF